MNRSTVRRGYSAIARTIAFVPFVVASVAFVVILSAPERPRSVRTGKSPTAAPHTHTAAAGMSLAQPASAAQAHYVSAQK